MGIFISFKISNTIFEDRMRDVILRTINYEGTFYQRIMQSTFLTHIRELLALIDLVI